ncbi:MAG: OmpA family protein [Bacteroidota bacterium]
MQTLVLRVLAFFILLIFSSSCVVIKKKDEYEALVADRNTLRRNLRDCERKGKGLRSDTTRMGKDMRSLEGKYAKLGDDYASLKERSQMTNESLSQSLREKEAALNDKDLLLQEREEKLRELQEIISRQKRASEELLGKLQNVLKGFAEDELSLELKNGKVYVSMSNKLLFSSGSAKVDKKGQQALETLARELNKNPDIDILIEGHTDDVPIKTGRFADNWDLSVIRATSIVRLLTGEYDVPPSRVTPSGRSEFFPVASNDTAEGRATNRRTEIILSPKLNELYNFLNEKVEDEE